MTKQGLLKVMAILEGATGKRYHEGCPPVWLAELEKETDEDGLEAAHTLARNALKLPVLAELIEKLGYIYFRRREEGERAERRKWLEPQTQEEKQTAKEADELVGFVADSFGPVK